MGKVYRKWMTGITNVADGATLDTFLCDTWVLEEDVRIIGWRL